MPYIGLTPGQKVTVTIHAHLDEVLHHGVKVSFGSGYQVEIFTETDDVSIEPGEWSVLDEPAVAYDPEDPNRPKAGA